MLNKTLIIVIAICIALPIINAEQQSLGTFKQNSIVNAVQFCDNSTYSNITLIIRPDAEFMVNEEKVMTRLGNKYNYTITETHMLGTYSVYGHCNENGADTNWGYTFEIASENGNTTDLAYVLVWILSFALLIAFFLSVRKVPLYRLSIAVMLMLNTFVGYYIINSPVASFISFIGILFLFKETIYFMNNVIDG